MDEKRFEDDYARTVGSANELRNACPSLFAEEGRSLFLSASIARQKEGDDLPDWLDAPSFQERYVATSRNDCVREAVSQLCGRVFAAGGNIVFGAHPSISPLILQAALDAPKGGDADDRVYVFQSRFFDQDIPKETLRLSRWARGRLIWTARGPDRASSLKRMRELMISVPSNRGAVFVGGMNGVEQEAEIFLTRHKNRPRFAVASTGSAAKVLFEGDGHGRCAQVDFGSGLDRHLERRAYGLLAKRIVERVFGAPAAAFQGGQP